MNKLGMIGGIGQGVMQGLQFMRQLDADKRADQALANQNEHLNMQRDLHGERMAEFKRIKDERERTDTLNTLNNSIQANYGDRSDYERAEMFRKYGVEMGQFKPAELEAATKVRDGLMQAAGPEAYQAMISGNLAPMKKLLGTKGYDIQEDAKSGNFLLRMPGSDAVQSINKEGVLQLDAMAAYRDQLAAQSKAALDARKTEAEIKQKEADANLKDRLPQDKFSLSASGVGGGKGGGKKGDGFPFDYDDAEKIAPLDETTGKPNPQKVANLYASAQNMYALNPALQSQPGVLMQVAAAIEKGDMKPEAVYDPATNTYFKGVKYGNGAVRIGSEADIDPDKFNGDKAATTGVRIATDRAWLPQYMGTIQDAKQRASIEAAIKADTPEGQKSRSEIVKKYNEAMASGGEVPLFLRQMYSALQTGDRLKAAPQEEKPKASASSKPSVSPADAETAKALGLDLDDPGVLGRLSAIKNRFTGAISGVLKRSQDANVESQLRLLAMNPNDRATKEWLYSRSIGNPELQARIKAAMTTNP